MRDFVYTLKQNAMAFTMAFCFFMRGEIVSFSTIWSIFYTENMSKLCPLSNEKIKKFFTNCDPVSDCRLPVTAEIYSAPKFCLSVAAALSPDICHSGTCQFNYMQIHCFLNSACCSDRKSYAVSQFLIFCMNLTSENTCRFSVSLILHEPSPENYMRIVRFSDSAWT